MKINRGHHSLDVPHFTALARRVSSSCQTLWLRADLRHYAAGLPCEQTAEVKSVLEKPDGLPPCSITPGLSEFVVFVVNG
jgi:hypothetical protein